MFLDMKDGAKIVSLKPFEPEVVRMNESNVSINISSWFKLMRQCDSFAAIVKLETHHYAQGWVSWKGDSGRYFIQTIDRSARNRYEMKTKRQK
jgi:H3 lysine-79-specific histone-lysine N-methyltransferase